MSRALPALPRGAKTSEEAWKILKCWQRLGKTRRPKNNSVGPPPKKEGGPRKEAASQSANSTELVARLPEKSKRLRLAIIALDAEELREWLQIEYLGNASERQP
jgi:hypothetical protein